MVELNQYLTAGETHVSNLILNHYHQLGMDEFDLVLYIQLIRHQQQGNRMPDLKQIARDMNCQVEYLYQRVARLVQLKVVELVSEQTMDGKKDDYYDTQSIFQHINSTQPMTKKEQIEERKITRQTLFKVIQEMIGRPMSSLENEMMDQWIDVDHYSIELIQLAMHESVIRRVKSPLRYADRILSAWKEKGIQETSEAREEIERGRQKNIERTLKERKKQDETIPIVNSWK